MKNTAIPDRIGTVFASSGQYNDIGTTSSTTSLAAGTATYDVGFPPLTMTAIASGGVPPAGKDMNGILLDITQKLQWSDAGMGSPFDSTFASSISGYPKGAVVPASDYSGFWFNQTDANSTSPEASDASSTGWVPVDHYGSTSVTLTSSSVTMTNLNAAKDRLVLSGTLTANVNLVVPAWIKKWEVINGFSGSYSVIVKTPSGTGISVPAGTNAILYGDGTNIVTNYAPGALISVKTITSTQSYTKSAGMKYAEVWIYGAGGGGGGVPAGSSTSTSTGGGGGGGAWVMFTISGSVITSSQTVTIGTGGTGGAAGGGTGGTGGASSFGSFVSCPGGLGAGYSTSAAIPISAGGAGVTAAPTVSSSVTVLASCRGAPGFPGFVSGGASGASGNGGSSPVGCGGGGASIGGYGYGSGGSGARSTNTDTTSSAGGAGSSGLCIIREYG